MSVSPSTRAELLFGKHLKRPPQGVASAPGRALLLDARAPDGAGDHLTAVLPHQVAVAYGLRPDSRVAVWAVDERAKDLFPQGDAAAAERRWAHLARLASARVSQVLNRQLPGVDLLIHGTIPRDAGCAASTALALAYVQALLGSVEGHRSKRELAGDAAAIERAAGASGAVGVDAWGLLQGAADHVTHIETPELRATNYPIPEGSSLAAQLAGDRPPTVRATTPSRLAQALRALDQQDAATLDKCLS